MVGAAGTDEEVRVGAAPAAEGSGRGRAAPATEGVVAKVVKAVGPEAVEPKKAGVPEDVEGVNEEVVEAVARMIVDASI
ncbi:hypothetical protein H0H92_001409, partial [Tricholoma furcatifolium]